MRSAADRAIEITAAEQFDLITRAQAFQRGHSRKTIDHRIATGRLLPVYPTVYALSGTPQSWHRTLLAAILWCGGIASHRAASLLYELPGVTSAPPEVTAFDHRVIPHSDVIVHHTNRLPPDQIEKVQRIPITSIERTLLDLGAVWPERRVAAAVDSALQRHLTTLGMLDRCLYLTARRGRRGCAVLRRVVHRRLGLTDFPESPLESMLFDLVAASSLPTPDPQVPIMDGEGRVIARPDLLYPGFKVAIEGHSVQWHASPEAHREDTRRHRRLLEMGFRVVYATYRDIVEMPEAVLARIERELRRAEWRPGAPAIGAELVKNG